jgi:hypothetical protein
MRFIGGSATLDPPYISRGTRDLKITIYDRAQSLAATKWQTKLLCQMQRSHGERIYSREV